MLHTGAKSKQIAWRIFPFVDGTCNYSTIKRKSVHHWSRWFQSWFHVLILHEIKSFLSKLVDCKTCRRFLNGPTAFLIDIFSTSPLRRYSKTPLWRTSPRFPHYLLWFSPFTHCPDHAHACTSHASGRHDTPITYVDIYTINRASGDVGRWRAIVSPLLMSYHRRRNHVVASFCLSHRRWRPNAV